MNWVSMRTASSHQDNAQNLVTCTALADGQGRAQSAKAAAFWLKHKAPPAGQKAAVWTVLGRQHAQGKLYSGIVWYFTMRFAGIFNNFGNTFESHWCTG